MKKTSKPNTIQPPLTASTSTTPKPSLESLAAKLAAKLSGLPILQDESMDRQQTEFDLQNNRTSSKQAAK